MLAGPTALAYGEAGVIDAARALVEWAKKIEKLELKGAILDGVLYEGKKGVEELSRFPTKSEAQAQVVTLILSPAKNVLGRVKGPGGKVMGILKTIEGKLEKGETIARVG
jgi:large subunit ribosomal protein L10